MSYHRFTPLLTPISVSPGPQIETATERYCRLLALADAGTPINQQFMRAAELEYATESRRIA